MLGEERASGADTGAEAAAGTQTVSGATLPDLGQQPLWLPAPG